ncbi:hypothetical protein ACHWQZ_G015763 [Mnemiopsis leidyi]
MTENLRWSVLTATLTLLILPFYCHDQTPAPDQTGAPEGTATPGGTLAVVDQTPAPDQTGAPERTATPGGTLAAVDQTPAPDQTGAPEGTATPGGTLAVVDQTPAPDQTGAPEGTADDTRERFEGEIAPVSAETSSCTLCTEVNQDLDPQQSDPNNAIDLDKTTSVMATEDGRTPRWVKVNFAEAYCIEEAMWLSWEYAADSILQKWVVQTDGTFACFGPFAALCGDDDYGLILEVFYKGSKATFEDDCVLGDSVQMTLYQDFPVEEFVVLGKPSEDEGPTPTELVMAVGCEAGAFLREYQCVQCGENSFSAAQDNVCTACPEGTTSPPGSTSLSDCLLIVDGGYSDFGDWSECSAECGGGTQTRSRTCTNPAPANGGADCEGDSSETRECNNQGCPVDGGYSDFGDWSECSAECGGGTQTRSRTCTNPAPANGGADCEGDSSETRECNTHRCPRPGFSAVSETLQIY